MGEVQCHESQVLFFAQEKRYWGTDSGGQAENEDRLHSHSTNGLPGAAIAPPHGAHARPLTCGRLDGAFAANQPDAFLHSEQTKVPL